MARTMWKWMDLVSVVFQLSALFSHHFDDDPIVFGLSLESIVVERN